MQIDCSILYDKLTHLFHTARIQTADKLITICLYSLSILTWYNIDHVSLQIFFNLPLSYTTIFNLSYVVQPYFYWVFQTVYTSDISLNCIAINTVWTKGKSTKIGLKITIFENNFHIQLVILFVTIFRRLFT